ncbi:MAG: hypothetical protein C0478_12065 [Planctomyces sp.]|nr:hypothetical protein [Planctomyces sp.]
MPVRYSFTTFCLLSVALGVTAQAQEGYFPQADSVYGPGGYAQPSFGQGPQGAGQYGQGMMPPQGPHGGYQHGYGPQGFSAPYPPAYGAPGNGFLEGNMPNTTYQQYPDDGGWLYADSPLEKGLKNTFRHGFFRLEYLLWDVEDPGNTVVGTDISGYRNNPGQIVPVSDPVTGTITGTGIVQNLDLISLKDNNGIRGTWGLPIFNGTLETSVFSLQTNTSRINGEVQLPSATGAIDGLFPIIPFVVDGQQLLQTFDRSYQASYRTSVWGTESNYVLDAFDPNAFFQVRPLIGFRYMNIRETLSQTGVNTRSGQDPTDPAATTYTTTIDSTANNNFYGPQIGLRTELVGKRFTLGAEPKAMLGLNSYKSSLAYAGTIEDQALVQNSVTDTTFGTILSIQAYGKVHLSESFSIFVSWEGMYTGFVTRPYLNVGYYGTAQTNPPTDTLTNDPKFTDVFLQGLTVGGELRY